LHSDVLNSFSWSFNVEGVKEWKFFFPPNSSPSHTSSPVPIIVIQQKAGEAIFVPCGLKHEVTNLEETLSINHNWITTANIDQVWNCICSEMKSIEVEVEAWQLGADCWDARESMLRGCVGLDVTGFFFMILVRLLELLFQVESLSEKTVDSSPQGHAQEVWQRHFDLVRLKQSLEALLRRQHGGNDTMPEKVISVQERLTAVLQSPKSAEAAVKIATWAIAEVDQTFIFI
jgi:hypothetical protein